MNKYKRRWFPKKPDCDSGVRGFLTVGLQEVKPALVLLCIGNGLAFALLVMEMLIHNAMLSCIRNKVPHRWTKTAHKFQGKIFKH